MYQLMCITYCQDENKQVTETEQGVQKSSKSDFN